VISSTASPSRAAGRAPDPQRPANGLPPGQRHALNLAARFVFRRLPASLGQGATSGNLDFIANSATSHRFEQPGQRIDERPCIHARLAAFDWNTARNCARHPSFTAHEALLLNYEQAFTPPGTASRRTGRTASAHMLWIGDRTRPAGGCPCGIHARHQQPHRRQRPAPAPNPDELAAADRCIEPRRIDPGPAESDRCVWVADKRRAHYAKAVVQAIEREGKQKFAVELPTPLHGQHHSKASSGFTRPATSPAILREVEQVFMPCINAEGTLGRRHPHRKWTGQNVHRMYLVAQRPWTEAGLSDRTTPIGSEA